MVRGRIGGANDTWGRESNSSGLCEGRGGGIRERVGLSDEGEEGEYVKGGRLRHLGNIRDVIGDGIERGIERGIKEGDNEVIV